MSEAQTALDYTIGQVVNMPTEFINDHAENDVRIIYGDEARDGFKKILEGSNVSIRLVKPIQTVDELGYLWLIELADYPYLGTQIVACDYFY